MLSVGDCPILEHNVRLAAQHGFNELVINVHHRSQAIVDHFGDGSRFGVSIRYSLEPELLGTAGALNPVRSFFERQTFAVLYGDNLTTCDLTAALRRHRAAEAVATIAVAEREDPRASGIVGIDTDGMVTRFLEKPKRDEIFSHWVNAGVLILEPAVLEAIPPKGASDFGRHVLPALLTNGRRVAAYEMREKFWWIDSRADYERTLAEFSHPSA
jgi:mannose-1-phosphate guanylyltransferase